MYEHFVWRERSLPPGLFRALFRALFCAPVLHAPLSGRVFSYLEVPLMRLSSILASSAVLSALSMLAFVGEARADEQPAPAAPAAGPAVAPATGAPQKDAPKEDDEEDSEFKSFALTANPLSLALLRVGVNIEYLPAKHHGIMLNPYYWGVTAG